MSDLHNLEQFIRGRWRWDAFGYQIGFKGKCAFSDIDAMVEFNGRRLLIESKFWNGQDESKLTLQKGQELALQREAGDKGRTVLVVYGDAERNLPLYVLNLNSGSVHDLRELQPWERRWEFKRHIDAAMGVSHTDAVHKVLKRRFDREPRFTPADICPACGQEKHGRRAA